MFSRDDRVVYTGSKYAGELGGKIGFVVAPVDRQPGAWVIDFPSDSYVMSERVLEKYRPSTKDENVPEVHTRRRRRSDDEE